jgi:hypothetical protein
MSGVRHAHLRPLAVAGGVALTVVVASIIAIASGAETRAAAPVEATAVFTTTLTARQAAEIVARYGAQLIELQFDYQAGPDARGGGYFVRDASSPERVASEFADAVRSMLVDEVTNMSVIATKYPADHGLAAQLAGLRAAAGSFPQRSVHTVRVLGDGNALTGLGSDPNVTRVILGGQRPPGRASSQKVPGLAAPATTHHWFGAWVPDTIHVTALDSSVSGQRYVQQVFIWNAGRILEFDSGWGIGQGFEAQFYTDFSDGLRYFSERDGNGFPVGNVWDSNLPSKYLVTSYGDSPNILGYMVGTYDGEYIGTGTWYNTYVRTPNGNASSDTAEIQPQQTTETQPLCNTTWCMKGHNTCVAGGYWNISIPVNDWVWNWNGTNC